MLAATASFSFLSSPRTVQVMFLKFYFLVLLVACCESAYQTRQRSKQNGNSRGNRVRQCSPPKLINGFVTPLYKGKMMRFDCNKGYYRLGERYSECINGRWSVYSFPTCIKNGCTAISAVDNGKITYLNSKATAMLFCEPNYEIVGSSYAHCNGTHWDRAIGTCKETDNMPPTFCDFESETICGWTHDADHDFDFERRSGYNNKTISILTGPSADHTVKIPFQGHYMVINTNTEVYVKKARLISPLFHLSAEKLCFEFYYHMYGISVGTLRVFQKPESMELQELLIEDTELEAKNDYVIFEVKGTQGNLWHRGTGKLKSFNESFQIIIEAVSGATRLSDIAFDDVSILTDADCEPDDDSDTKADEDSKDDDDVESIFDVESCLNRCFEESNSTVHLNANKTLTCSCSRDCDWKATCCPDFLDICMKNDSTIGDNSLENTTTIQTEKITTTTEKLTSTSTEKAKTTFEKPTTTTPSTTEKPTPSTVKITTKITTLKTTQQQATAKATTSTKVPKGIESTQNATEMSEKEVMITTDNYVQANSNETETKAEAFTMQPPQTTSPSITTNENAVERKTIPPTDVEELPEHIEDESDITPDDGNDDEKIKNEKLMMYEEKNGNEKKFTLFITIVIIVVSSVLFGSVAIYIVYRQYRKTTNPLNYKEKGESGSSRANEEFSEIRFLTSDEALDFNLATADDFTDL